MTDRGQCSRTRSHRPLRDGRSTARAAAAFASLLALASLTGPAALVGPALAAPPLACPDIPLPVHTDTVPADVGGGAKSLVCEYAVMDDNSDPTGYTVAIEALWYEEPGPGAADLCASNLVNGADNATPQAIENLDHAAVVSWMVTSTTYQGSQIEEDGIAVPVWVPPAAGEMDWAFDAVAVACDDAGSAAAPPATEPTSPSTTATTPEADHKPLCTEAVALLEGFGSDRLPAAGITDTSRTGMRVDGDEILADMRTAIADYNTAHPEGGAYVSDGTPFAGEAGAVSWLFGYGGAVGGPVAQAYVTGSELDLQKRLITRARRQGVGGRPDRLTPGEVLEEALALTDGNVNQAMLAAHNLLRGSARNDSVAAPGVLMDSGAFINEYLAPLRDGENGGPWYHLFGTAYMELTAQGDWGPWIAAGGAAAAFSAGLLAAPAAVAVAGVALAWQHESDTSGTTNASRFSNGLEQVVRETGWRERAGNQPDPEKFCFNVWGAQAGARLYHDLPYHSTRSLHRVLSSFSSPGESPQIDPVAHLRDARFVSSVESPFAVHLDDGRLTMTLDQGAEPGSASLAGGVPGWFMPVYEGDTWGVAWAEETSASATLTLEATRDDAQLHFVRTDLVTGETARYESTAAHRGDMFSVALDPGTVSPTMTDGAGHRVIPRLSTIEVAPATEARGSDAAPSRTAVGEGADVAATLDERHAGSTGAPGSSMPLQTLLVGLGVVAVAVVTELRRLR